MPQALRLAVATEPQDPTAPAVAAAKVYARWQRIVPAIEWTPLSGRLR